MPPPIITSSLCRSLRCLVLGIVQHIEQQPHSLVDILIDNIPQPNIMALDWQLIWTLFPYFGINLALSITNKMLLEDVG